MEVYMVQKQSDMIEGRGQMVNDKCFLRYKDAVNYMDSQLGIMGRKAKWFSKKYGDWKIVTIYIFEGPFDERQVIIQQALAKLTDKERQVLGI